MTFKLFKKKKKLNLLDTQDLKACICYSNVCVDVQEINNHK